MQIKTGRKIYRGTGVLSSAALLSRAKESALIHKAQVCLQACSSRTCRSPSTDPTLSPSLGLGWATKSLPRPLPSPVHSSCLTGSVGAPAMGGWNGFFSIWRPLPEVISSDDCSLQKAGVGVRTPCAGGGGTDTLAPRLSAFHWFGEDPWAASPGCRNCRVCVSSTFINTSKLKRKGEFWNKGCCERDVPTSE